MWMIWSIENAKENIEKNGCRNIDIQLSSILPDQAFDIILANINRNVILQYLPQLKKMLAEDGYLLLSGLMTSDGEDIIQACNANELELVKQTEKNNWISLLFTNKN